jgi:hypothetical protein
MDSDRHRHINAIIGRQFAIPMLTARIALAASYPIPAGKNCGEELEELDTH